MTTAKTPGWETRGLNQWLNGTRNNYSVSPPVKPMVWETLAVEALALLASCTAEMTVYVILRHKLDAQHFPALYKLAYLDISERAYALVKSDKPLDRVDMVEVGQWLQEQQEHAGTQVWQRITGNQLFSHAAPYGTAETALIDRAVKELKQQHFFQSINDVREYLTDCLDTGDLKYAMLAGNRLVATLEDWKEVA